MPATKTARTRPPPSPAAPSLVAEPVTDDRPRLTSCPDCGTAYDPRRAHEHDPVGLWRRAVAAWNTLTGAEQLARIAACREDGHDERPVPVSGMVMCWRCGAYRVHKENA